MSMENRTMNKRSCPTARSREDLMDLISKVSFALDDTRLFLDTHPTCTEAMDFFKKMQHIRREAMKEYTERYGTISGYDMGSSDVWSWNAGNYPWLQDKKGGC